MNYIGSKFRLSSWIKEEVHRVVGEDISDKVFCDLFAGTGMVGRTFKLHVKQVISNDLEHYSFVLNRNYIGNHREIERTEHYIDLLNALPLTEDGFIYNNYCLGSGSGRQYFSDNNGKKIDAIRSKIEELKTTDTIDENLYYFLIASLIESADRVANTASVYHAHLKHLKKTASENMVLEAAEFLHNKNEHQVFNEDSNKLIHVISGDILYLDPPYNQRHYGANYHILNTISNYKSFTPKGKTGLPSYNNSDYSYKTRAFDALEELIRAAKFKYVFLSYNNEGLIGEYEIKQMMRKYGEYSLVKKEYKRFKGNRIKDQGLKTFEHLHVLEKRV